MATTDALTLNRLIHEQIGDHLGVVTTIILTNTNTHVISTNLNQFDGGRDDYFTDWWLYVTDKNNAGQDRKIRNYYTANNTCNVYGSAWTTDSVQSNVRIQRFSYTDTQRALNDAIRETYPTLHRELDDRSSVVTNSKLYEYALPTDFQVGTVSQVLVNTSRSPTTVSDDAWQRIFGWEVINAGTAIRLPDLYTTGYKVRLLGLAPLETVTNTTDVVNVSGERLNMLIAYAKYKLYQQIEGYPASNDTSRYEKQSAKAYQEYVRLKSQIQPMKPATTMNLRTY